jgi:hypothetical protein
MSRTARVVTTFALLFGGYLGYVRGFAVVAGRLQPPVVRRPQFHLVRQTQTKSGKEATELAVRVFGEDHWAAKSANRYYNVERGYWMYWEKYDQPEGFDGRRITFKPFAVIWRSKDNNAVKFLSADRAIVDFKQEFNLFKPGGKLDLAYARIEGGNDYVLIQDDKGTPDLDDDLVITMPYAEYLEEEGEIRCAETVHLTERDVSVQGKGLNIVLRGKPGVRGEGFPGAETVTLKSEVLIEAEDVGKTGILPGAARPEQQIPAGQLASEARTPVTITCDGPLVLKLPTPRMPPLVGPPAPRAPTLADFARNVVVRRGTGLPDQINGDNLRAILIPRERQTGQADDNSLGGLTLYEAIVTGHAVWLQSEAERTKILVNELIHRKPGPNLPEETFLHADRGKQIYMERVEVDEKGQPQGLLIVRSVDATLRGSAEAGGSTIVARGPGRLEQRLARDQPVERSATWQNELIVDTQASGAKPPGKAAEPARTYITLKGWPVVDDPQQAIMAARDQMLVCLIPRSDGPAQREKGALVADGAQATAATAAKSGNAYRIEWVTAFGDVHMSTPQIMPDGRPAPDGPRFLNAREKLDVVFEYPRATAPLAFVPLRTVRLASFHPRQDGRPALGGFGAPSHDFTAIEQPIADEEEEQVLVSSKSEQALDVVADRVWARVEMSPEGGGVNNLAQRPSQPGVGDNDMKEVRLRGNVQVRQDPAEDRTQGIDLDAAAVDVVNGGKGRLKIYAHGWDDRPAVLVSPEMTIEGPLLGLDQSRHYAWVDGLGQLTMQAKKSGTGLTGVFADGREVPIEGDATADEEEKVPLLITWAKEMTFNGIYPDERGRSGPARALFIGDVKASMKDDHVRAQQLEAIMDRSVSFDRSFQSANSPNPQAETQRPEVESLIASGRVTVESLVRDELGDIVESRSARGESITFERPSGQYWIDEVGTVLITGPEDSEDETDPSDPLAGLGGRNARKPVANSKLIQTRVDFRKGMRGMIGMDRSGKADGYRDATFRGDVQVLRAGVKDLTVELNQDRRPTDAMYEEADELILESYSREATPDSVSQTLMRAYGGAQLSTATTAIKGDTTVYDSRSDCVFIRGSNAPVTIVSQEKFGQQQSRTYPRAVVHNLRTKQTQLLDPGSIQIFEPGSGYRSGKTSPPKPKVKKPKKRPNPRMTPRGDIERRGFVGA